MKLLTKIIAPGIILTAALLTTTNAFADATEDWYYDCNDPVESKVAKPVPPNIYIMQDTSGSMSWDDRWVAARSGILALLDDNRTNHIANYGLGTYSTRVRHQHDCGTNSTQPIYATVWDWNSGTMVGNTNTSGAVRAAMSNRCNTQRGPGQSSATMLITDGAPNSPRESLRAACEHRNVAKLYVVGLGTGTDVDFNNVLAAAGGSGSCPTLGDPCANQSSVVLGGSRQRLSRQWAKDCSGSYTVTDTAALTDALRTIVAEVSCIFPVEATNGATVVPEDPNNRYPWVRVETVDASGTASRVPYANGPDYNSSDPGWSWTFASADRKTVSLGAKACTSLKRSVPNHNKAEAVTTQLGCICEQTLNTACGDNGYWSIPGVCPEGTWRCDRGKDICEMPKSASKTDKPCTVPNTYSHCAKGLYECRSNGDVLCVQQTGPMPELCNGYDDDCDGRIDNISQSWRKSDRASYVYSLDRKSDLFRKTYSRACLFLDICVCKEANPNMTMADGSNFSEDYPQYLDDWTNNHGTCNCSPN